MAKRPLRILHVEDSPAEAQLMARAVRDAGQEVEWKRVESEAEYLRALQAPPDVVISDYRLPRFNALRALELLRQLHPDIPFIAVSEPIGEEKAAQLVRLGARDYLLKQNIGRLPAAIKNAVQTAGDRSAERKAQSDLDALGQRLRALVSVLPDVVWSIALPSLDVLYISPAAAKVFGREPREFYVDHNAWEEVLYPEDRPRVLMEWQKSHPGEYRSEYRIVLPSGDVRWIQGHGRFIVDASGRVVRADGISRDITDLVGLHNALREREAGLGQAQLMAKLAHVVSGPDGTFERWSDMLARLAGVTPDAVPRNTRGWLELVHPDDRDRFRAASIEAARTRSRIELEYRLRNPGGGLIHVRQTIEPLRDAHADGGLRWFNTLQDVTDMKLAQERIQRMNRVYAVLSSINAAIVRIRGEAELLKEACRIAVEAGRFVMAWVGLLDNETSVLRPVAMAGREVKDFLDKAQLTVLENKPGGHRWFASQAIRKKAPILSNDINKDADRMMCDDLAKRGINSIAVLPLIQDGEAVGVLALYAADVGFFDDEELRLLGELAGDVSYALDQIDKARKLDYVSYYDTLTGLPNRTLFHERLKLQLDDAARKGERVALLVLDVERFKRINDSLGRHAGDALLVEVAKRMRQGSLSTSWFARLEADHFAIVMPGLTAAEQIARQSDHRYAEVFGIAFDIGGKLRASARYGIALFPDDAADADTLLRNAEAALKKAKSSAERYVFYTPQMTARIAEKLALENRLRQALEKDEFVLHYQPKVDLNGRKVVGMEALIRWQSPDLGLVPPGQFVPLLEETGLILEVGSWALRRAAHDHRSWVEAGLTPPRVAVNVSAIQLRQRGFVEIVERSIAEGVSPTVIDLEITETLIMEDIQASIEKLSAIRRLGVGIAIDDFGTGYSSLFYLARLPVEALKIDRSFVATMLEDAATMTLVQTMISLAHSLRLKVIAEGVETEAQAEILKRLRCDQMQGFVFSRPLSKENVAALLKSQHRGL